MVLWSFFWSKQQNAINQGLTHVDTTKQISAGQGNLYYRKSTWWHSCLWVGEVLCSGLQERVQGRAVDSLERHADLSGVNHPPHKDQDWSDPLSGIHWLFCTQRILSRGCKHLYIWHLQPPARLLHALLEMGCLCSSSEAESQVAKFSLYLPASVLSAINSYFISATFGLAGISFYGFPSTQGYHP